jgi:hypothetical protein
MKLAIFDQALPREIVPKVIQQFSVPSIPNCWIPSQEMPKVFLPLINNASKIIDLSKMTGIELWTQHNTRTNWHHDKDEVVHSETGNFVFPLASMVFYANVLNLVGGELYLDNGVKVTPAPNRQVVFSPGEYHKVGNFYGQRLSILLNPWDNQPEGIDIISKELLKELQSLDS